MFVTFYSYKGGVGRTLALANAAYLIATHEEEPCRVLIWDFDLEAPGLQHVFKCKWGGKKGGFVDFVYEYITKAEIPQIEHYIYPTDVEGVDILPAGNVGRSYSKKLEKINWRDVYAKRRGEDFMNAVRSAIADIGLESGYRTYDYVLIDSRTGYSDVGGICVHQLPDAVVLMFRLNDQNIRGIHEVYKTIRAYADSQEDHDIQIVPVISPAWPFGTTEGKTQVDKAQEAFGDEKLLTITFDSALTFGEKIITRDREQYAGDLRICHDYEQLTFKLRQLNIFDPLTMVRQAHDLARRGDTEGVFGVFRQLINRRPDQERRWDDMIASLERSLPGSLYLHRGRPTRKGKEKDIIDEVEEFLDKFIEEHPESVPAILARARWRSRVKEKPQDALEDYARALQLAPDDPEIRLSRARVNMGLESYEAALTDLNEALEARPSESQLLLERGRCFAAVQKPLEALRDYEAVITALPGDSLVLFEATKLAFRQKSFERALSWGEKIPEHGFRGEYATLLRIHTLSALGRREEAADLLASARSAKYIERDVNLVEALIVVGNLDEARSTLHALQEHRAHEVAALMLGAIVDALKGELDAGQVAIAELVAKEKTPIPWDFTELNVFLDTASERGDIDPTTADTIRSWIEQLSSQPAATAEADGE